MKKKTKIILKKHQKIPILKKIFPMMVIIYLKIMIPKKIVPMTMKCLTKIMTLKKSLKKIQMVMMMDIVKISVKMVQLIILTI